MKTRAFLTLTALLLAPLAVLHAAVPPVVGWTFDEARDTGAVQQARERLDSLQRAIELVPGVRGSGLKFDGFTSRLVRVADDLPQFGPALTVEAWIAPQEYSWAWTGIVDHDQDAACPGSHPSCVKTAARCRPLRPVSCPN